MSREIKFRAWDKKRKRYAKVIQTTNQGWKGYRDKTYITNGVMLFSKWVLSRFIIEQYTGLKDKNGIEIYEGDIVEIDKYGKFQIIWNEWACKFDFDKIGKREREEPLLSQDWEQKIEVIGNIHEKDKLVDFDHVKGGGE